MIRSDFHLHTVFCDGRNTPLEMAESAVGKGFKAIGFSGHSYAPYDTDCCMDPKNTEKYRRVIASLKEEFSGKIDIYCGVEQDYYSPVSRKPFDYSIGSVHYLKTGCQYTSVDYTPQVLAGMRDDHFGGDIYALIEEYYRLVADVVNRTGCSIIGHFDLISKFNEDGSFFDPRHPRYIAASRDAADALLKYGIPFEINTGAIFRGYRSEPYPSLDLIRYIWSKNGRFILSSDAHCKDGIGFEFEKFFEMLSKEGIKIEEFCP